MFAVVLTATLVIATTAAILFKQAMDAAPPIPDRQTLLMSNQAPGMTFEDHNGQVIATRGPKHGVPVTLSGLPAYVPRAFLAAEDRRFYQHGPLYFQGIARAAYANLRAHHVVQGGSTLTQQLAKTLFLTPDQTLTRKIQEAAIAIRLEQAMSKDEILELYLNRIYFGDNSYGVEAAAQTYFGKPASALSLQEAALLAGLPKAPTRLALTNDMHAALARSRLILSTMHAEGWISAADEQQALASPPKLAPEAPGEGDFGYVLDMAAEQAVQTTGGGAPDLIVRLSIDPALQTQAQTIVRDAIDAEGGRAGVSQAALVLLSPDGGIRALVGGRDHRDSAFNRATQAQRQPGSSFKPFVYATALENGVKPTDTRVDGPVRFGLWSPENFGGGHQGPVTIAEALAHSINTIAVQLANQVGPAKIAQLAHRFGVKSVPDDPGLSIALGAYEVNLLELTSGFQVFQQGGQRAPPYLIEQITTARGDNLYSHVSSASLGVYDVANAGEMVRMMEGVITHGTGTRANFGRPAAGKTGTASDYRDAWFVGFTPDWVCGVWVGNDDHSATNQVTGGQMPAEIWRKMMVVAHKDLPVHDFAWLPAETPDVGADSGAPDADSAAADAAPDDRRDFYGRLQQDFNDATQPSAPAPDAPRDQAPAPDYGRQDYGRQDYGRPDYAPPPDDTPAYRDQPPDNAPAGHDQPPPADAQDNGR